MKKYWKYMAFAAVALLGVGAAACSDDEGDTSWSATYAYLVPQHLGILDKAVTLSIRPKASAAMHRLCSAWV